MRPKIRSSVSTIILQDNIIEFFLSNTRRQVRIKLPNEQLFNLLLKLDGSKSERQIADEYKLDEAAAEGLNKILLFLQQRSVITDADFKSSDLDGGAYRRVIHFLEDYSSSSEDLSFMWNNIRQSHVVIVGLGAVGTWVALTLAQSGVKHFTLVDHDTVELSNLHRQLSYFEEDVGKFKVEVTARNIQALDPEILVETHIQSLSEDSLDGLLSDVNLVINCADYPTVDLTARWVGKSCMPRSIPHIIAGGYNLHLSLIGQTIIPFKSACIKCFELELERINVIDTKNIKKLLIENRKIGSFGPMCAISASMVSMEAVKVLTGKIEPANLNRRGEFDIYSMNITYTNVTRLHECSWCGEVGLYTTNRSMVLQDVKTVFLV